MGTKHHEETAGPEETPDPNGENTTVPEQGDSAPIPFAHDGDDEDQTEK